MIKNVSPLFRKALQDGIEPLYFVDLHLNVLNATVDSAADWGIYSSKNNIDLISALGFARLSETGTYTISQATQNTAHDMVNHDDGTFGPLWEQTYLWQSFYLSIGRVIKSVIVNINNNSGADAYVKIGIYSSDKTMLIGQSTILGIENSITGEQTAIFNDLALEPGEYYLCVDASHGCDLRYQNTHVYTDGQLDIELRRVRTPNMTYLYSSWTTNVGDLYFKINMSSMAASGSILTGMMSLPSAPIYPGKFQAAYQVPADTSCTFTLHGSDTGAFGGEETAYPNVKDGDDIALHQYWKAYIELTSNPDGSTTPVVDMVEVIYPKDIVRLRENIALKNVNKAIISAFSPMLGNVSFKPGEIKTTERVSSGGEMSITINDTAGDTISRIIADSPLKNHRAIVYIGADVPGFSESQLFIHFTGIVESPSVKPRFERNSYSLSLKIKNPITELKRKVPLPSATGVLSSTATYISYDGTHVMDAIADVLGSQAGIPARYVDLNSLKMAKYSIGDNYVDSSLFIIRRSSNAGLPDTRIKGPVETRKILEPLCLIADGYIIIGENGRISFIKHDPTAASEAAWADKKLVYAGYAADAAIYDIGEIDLGYEERLFNCVMMGSSWDGGGEDWQDFGFVYASVNADSVDTFAPGQAQYLSVMEKNMKEASQYLGPNEGYNGNKIATNLADRFASRSAFPPLVLKNVIVPQTELIRGVGGRISVVSDEVMKYGSRRQAASSPLKCLIMSIKPELWNGARCVNATLMELK